jgi:CSLREA domain-containing protein
MHPHQWQSSRWWLWRLTGAAVLVLLLSIAGPARAATLIVDNLDDNTTSGNDFCTLREAITNANASSNTTSGDCAAGAGVDAIAFRRSLSVSGSPRSWRSSNDCNRSLIPGGKCNCSNVSSFTK